jgi:methylmalonyl-CoA epimerase
MKTPSIWEVDHIGLAVSDLQQAINLYSRTAQAQVVLRETLASQGVELAFLNTGNSKIELLAPLNSTGALARFLDKRGPGLHHICYKVADIQSELARLSQLGCTLIDATPRLGAGGSQIAFIAPNSFMGVLTELCQHP